MLQGLENSRWRLGSSRTIKGLRGPAALAGLSGPKFASRTPATFVLGRGHPQRTRPSPQQHRTAMPKRRHPQRTRPSSQMPCSLTNQTGLHVPGTVHDTMLLEGEVPEIIHSAMLPFSSENKARIHEKTHVHQHTSRAAVQIVVLLIRGDNFRRRARTPVGTTASASSCTSLVWGLGFRVRVSRATRSSHMGSATSKDITSMSG